MKQIKKLFVAVFAAMSYLCAFADIGDDLDIKLNPPQAPKQNFSLSIFPKDKNLQSVRINTNALQSRFFFSIRWKDESGGRSGTRVFNFFDIGRTSPKYKAYKTDTKNGAHVELAALTKMTLRFLSNMDDFDPEKVSEITFDLSLSHLTPKTQNGETEYKTQEIVLTGEQLRALVKAHKK